MSTKMKTKDLLNALSIVKPGLSSKEGILEQSTSFAFIDGRVVTYNDEVSVSHPVEALNITGAVKAELLYNFLSKVSAEEISISLADNYIKIVCGKSKVKLAIEPEIKLDLSELQNPKKWKSISPTFLDDIKFASMAAGKDQSYAVFTCINIREDGIIETTDRYRACRCYGDFDQSFLLPADVVQDIVRVNPTKICLEKSWVHFKSKEGTIISCRIFEAKYADLDPFFNEKEWGEEFKFHPDIIDVVQRAMVFTKEGYSLDTFLHVTIDKGCVTIKTECEFGNFEESAEIEYSGNTLQFRIVPYLFLDILKEKDTIVSHSDKLLKFKGGNWEYIAALS